MALELAIRITEIDDLLTYFKIEDENDTLDDSKQYGNSGNPARSALGLFLYVTKKEVGGVDDVIIFDGGNNPDPETATFWQPDFAEDNWYESVLIAGNDYVPGNTYAENDIVYSSDRLWRSLQASNSGNTPENEVLWWVDVTNDKDNILETGNASTYYTVEINDALFDHASVVYAQTVADNSKNGICSACDHEDKEALDRIDFHLQAAGVADYQQLYTLAQWNIETLKTLTA